MIVHRGILSCEKNKCPGTSGPDEGKGKGADSLQNGSAAVAKAEKLEATEEEYEQELRRLSARYMMEKDRVRAILRGEEETRIRQDIAVAKAAEYVAQNVRIDS